MLTDIWISSSLFVGFGFGSEYWFSLENVPCRSILRLYNYSFSFNYLINFKVTIKIESVYSVYICIKWSVQNILLELAYAVQKFLLYASFIQMHCFSSVQNWQDTGVCMHTAQFGQYHSVDRLIQILTSLPSFLSVFVSFCYFVNFRSWCNIFAFDKFWINVTEQKWRRDE